MTTSWTHQRRHHRIVLFPTDHQLAVLKAELLPGPSIFLPFDSTDQQNSEKF